MLALLHLIVTFDPVGAILHSIDRINGMYSIYFTISTKNYKIYLIL
jgi:hypothetical protein